MLIVFKSLLSWCDVSNKRAVWEQPMKSVKCIY